jgi:peptide deformylase
VPKLKIQTGADNEILRTKSSEIKNTKAKTPRLGLSLNELARGMKKILNEQKGLGLAAPQVGENVRMILVRMNSGSDHEMIFVMVNPEIVESSWSGSGSGAAGSLATGVAVGKVKKSAEMRVGSSEIENIGKTIEGIVVPEGAREALASADADVAEEGCLSLPEYYVNVIRASEITVRFLDAGSGKLAPMILELSGLNARVVQHEVDHLNGILICDKTVA